MALVAAELSDDQLQRLYTWVDEIPLSRPKRNIARDFSDAVLLAEVIRHYFPSMVELHNYPSANSTQQKMYNWTTLNSKVLRKLGYNMAKEDIEAVIQCRPNAVERVLNEVQMKMARYRARIRAATPDRGVSPMRSDGGRSDGAGRAPSVGRAPSRGEAASPAARAAASRVPSPRDAPAGSAWRSPSSGRTSCVAGGNGAYPPPVPGGHDQTGLSAQQRSSGYEALLAEREQSIAEYKETVEILELKITKLEQLVRTKKHAAIIIAMYRLSLTFVCPPPRVIVVMLLAGSSQRCKDRKVTGSTHPPRSRAGVRATLMARAIERVSPLRSAVHHSPRVRGQSGGQVKGHKNETGPPRGYKINLTPRLSCAYNKEATRLLWWLALLLKTTGVLDLAGA